MVIETIKCKKYLLDKDLNCFRSKIRNNKISYEHTCKQCNSLEASKKRKTDEYRELQREYYHANKDKINANRKSRYIPRIKKAKRSKKEVYEKQQEWRKNNPDKRKATVNKYHKTHKDKENKYCEENKDKIKERAKLYYNNNRENINLKIKLRRQNPIVKLHHNVSSLVRYYIIGVKTAQS